MINPGESRTAAKRTVGAGEMIVSDTFGDILVAYSLGSCIGIAAYDPCIAVGGVVHLQMPLASINPERASREPCVFVDTGMPHFFRALYAAGVKRDRLIIKVVGAASSGQGAVNQFEFGKQNLVVLRKLFWKNNILVQTNTADIGGRKPRTMWLEIGTGRICVTTAGETNPWVAEAIASRSSDYSRGETNGS
jgi:chemotaxis protein CheD